MYRDISNIVATGTWGGLVQHIELPGNITNGRSNMVPEKSFSFPSAVILGSRCQRMETMELNFSIIRTWARWFKWLEREFTDHKVRGSNPTSASGLPLSRLEQPGSIPALVLPSGGMAAKHRRGSENRITTQLNVFVEIRSIWVQVEHKVDRS
ncbi:hypothetical protein CSKR_110234 [Clonorchis sinensis]|uniref:Uncharacterized protein n=1 Tax=Clonorchis sinensis TaxID=79923 RepID=A0A419PF25_CLOSI|nr:hypothetical protein CSKR_110234 [Clonorchis sinensis]